MQLEIKSWQQAGVITRRKGAVMQEAFERIIDQLKAESIIVDDDAGNRAVEIIEQAAEEFAHDTNVRSNGWIPCSERLPERNKAVLIYMKSTTISGTELIMVGSCDNGFWFVQDGVDVLGFPCNQYKVIAWQPLPGPYQPKGE